MHCPIYRNRFLSPFAVDTMARCGWRRPVEFENSPDSFQVSCHRSRGINRLFHHVCEIDSLYLRLPFTDIDSVEISAFYDNRLEDSSLVLIFSQDRVMPIMATAEYVKDNSPFEFDLVVENSGPEGVELTLGYDSHRLESPESQMWLGGYETAVIPFHAQLTDSDSLELMIVIQDRFRRYHPYLATVPYPPQGHTDVDNGSWELPVGSIKAYPNPCRERLVISPVFQSRSIEVEIYNVTGQLVNRLSSRSDGDIIWEARNSHGEKLPTGIYFVRVAGLKGGAWTRKIVLLQ
jgi:hypothetical protein